MNSSSTITVIKLGGALLEHKHGRKEVLTAVTSYPGHCILVHGGGREATAWGDRAGIPSTLVDGRRVTGKDMLDVVTMVYGGLVNKRLVAELSALGRPAIGLTGADANCILAQRRFGADIDYGFVGDILAVNFDVLMQLLEAKLLPVLAPLTHDGDGQLLNTNADSIAAAVATASAEHATTQLLLALDRPGVQDAKQHTLPVIDRDMLQHGINSGYINGGMIPKVQAALSASTRGVSRVVLCAAGDIAAAAQGGEGNWTQVRTSAQRREVASI
ncbi:acetylglutamate kinase [bacterium]|nr:acetylglutamate kinase [bacterium]